MNSVLKSSEVLQASVILGKKRIVSVISIPILIGLGVLAPKKGAVTIIGATLMAAKINRQRSPHGSRADSSEKKLR